MRQITLDGRIGKDGAKVMKTEKGKEYIRFSLANDSFVNGANKTEWFEITCFDPFIVEKKAEYLTQGRYTIVQGVLNSEVSRSKDGTIYLNHYVRANNIEMPSIGSRKENNVAQVSTYTGGTKSEAVMTESAQPAPQAQTAPQQQAQPQLFTAQTSAPAGWNNDDDLPF